MGRPVSTDTGIMKPDIQVRVSGEVVVLDVLGVEALVGDAVTQKHNRVTVFQIKLGNRGPGLGDQKCWQDQQSCKQG